MTDKQIILIDMDDTIECLVPAWCRYLNSKYGTAVMPEDITAWDMAGFFPALTREQVYEPVHCDDFWKTVEPKPDAAEYIKLLMEEGYQIYLCTSTDYRNIRAKYEYIIQKYFPFIPWDRVIVASKKQMIRADFLVDDGIHNLVGGNYKKILMTASHNRNYDAAANGMFRADHWSDVYRIIQEESKAL